MNARIKKLRQRLLESIPSVDIHRARLITQAYQDAIGETIVTVRGKALYKIFAETPIAIGEWIRGRGLIS
jgi:hypothetical protein